MTIRFFGPLLCGGLLMFAALTPTPAPAAQTNVRCSLTKMKISVSELDSSSTTSTTFKTLPEASVSFTQGGISANCVVVRFSAVTVSGPNDGVKIRAHMDNTTVALPGEVFYSGDEGAAFGARSYDFVFPSVAPGSHVLRMQFRSTNGNIVYVHRHTTIVQHAP